MISADRKVLFGFVRLSIPTPESKPVFKSLEGMGLIREIHVNNPVVKLVLKIIINLNLNIEVLERN